MKMFKNAGKMPDAREEARNFVRNWRKSKIDRVFELGLRIRVADIQKRTLLAAAAYFMDGNSPIGAAVAKELERLAEEIGRQG